MINWGQLDPGQQLLAVQLRMQPDMPCKALLGLMIYNPCVLQLCGHLKLGQLLAVELLMTPGSPQDSTTEAIRD